MSDKFNKFVSLMLVHFPDVTIAYKDESSLMRFVSRLLFFNHGFMTDFVTTIGNTVYFPSRTFIENDPDLSIQIFAHECVHINDSTKFGNVVFTLLYLLPQLLVLFTIPALFLFGWWGLLGLLLLGPIPSPTRSYIEKRGYIMSLFVLDRQYRAIGLSDNERILNLHKSAQMISSRYFAGSAYYFAWPSGITTELMEAIKAIDSGDILDTDEVFRHVDAALVSLRS